MSYLVQLRARGFWLLFAIAVAAGGCVDLKLRGIGAGEEPPAEEPPAEGPPAEEPPAEEPPAESSARIEVGATALLATEGGSTPLTVRLSRVPTGAVTVTAVLVGGGGFTFEPASVSFSPGDWSTFKTITVRSAADGDDQNDWGRIRLTASGYDSRTIDVTQQDTEGAPVESTGVGLKVKDGAGAGAFGWPVTAVIPLEYGKFQDTAGFRMVGPDGSPVPAQFHVMNRWWGRDGSLRHVTAHFQATVPPNGQSIYTFQTSGGNAAPGKAVGIEEDAAKITVDTGVVRFVVKKQGFNLFDEVWLDSDGDGSYSAAEKIVSANVDAGPVFTGRLGVQRPRDRNDLRVVVEESGPVRAVIRVSGLTKYNGTEDHTHGFAVRIFAYAGKPFVKVDYQLQNSAKNVRYAWPLYFEDVSLHLKPNLTGPTLRLAANGGNVWSGTVGGGRHLFQDSDRTAKVRNSSDNQVLKSGSNEPGRSSYGWADLSDSNRGVFVTIRHMAEMWPNGVEISGDNDMAVRLWPKWSAQWHGGGISGSGLYWLEDMQHVVKETLFYFHGADTSSDELDAVARNFQQHPIPFVPTSWYHRTKVTLDLSGIMPSPEADSRGEDQRSVYYHYAASLDTGSAGYALGWANFGGDTGRKNAGNAGGVPNSGYRVVGSERVDMWMASEAKAIGDLNCRPMWMAEYNLEDDLERVDLTQNNSPGGITWRSKRENKTIDAPYLSGTGFGGWQPVDNSHAWLYHVEDFYNVSADPWIRDWYEFMKEFRRSERTQPGSATWWHDSNSFYNNIRGEAHSWAGLVAAYRVTGDPKVKDAIEFRLRNTVWPNRSEVYGNFNITQEAAFQMGYMARALIHVLDEFRYGDRQLHDEAFQILWGMMDWNRHMSGFANYINTSADAPGAKGSSKFAVTMIAPVAWFGLNTGDADMLDFVRTYILEGVNGGDAPTGNQTDWSNDFWGYDTSGGGLARLGEYVMTYSIAPNPPARITNLTAARNGGGVRIQWTTPARAQRFHVVWSTKPFTATYDRSDSVRSPWAGRPVGNTLVAAPGTSQSLTFDGLPAGSTVYVAVFTFDAENSMSAMSNVASVTLP